MSYFALVTGNGKSHANSAQKVRDVASYVFMDVDVVSINYGVVLTVLTVAWSDGSVGPATKKL